LIESISKTNPVVLIGGPTASGKSELAQDLALEIEGVIINGDSLQLYKGLSLLTARPTNKELKIIDHRLYGIYPHTRPCSVAEWQKLAFQEIRECENNNKIPVVVGGTGLYLKSLVDGIADIPEVTAKTHQNTINLRDIIGANTFHRYLRIIDPVMAGRLHPNDTQRMIRAFEVILATGKSLAYWQEQKELLTSPLPNPIIFILNPPRHEIYALANQRFKAMLKNGAIEEIKALIKRNINNKAPIFNALGAKEILGYLKGKYSLGEATTLAQIQTRRYIKRQYTWFRHQFPRAFQIPYTYSKQTKNKVLLMCRKKLPKYLYKTRP
jgi:tRNA dimethylallyltransferase